VNEADGFSKFPGNINEIFIDLTKYLSALEDSGGKVDEFINPKYTDGTRAAFKSPTRLECMMQDYAKTVPAGQTVGWTRYPIEFGYFPCKNDIRTSARLSAAGVPPHSASTAEMAVYAMHASALRRLGVSTADPEVRSFRGVKVEVGPSIVLWPSFAPCTTLLRAKLPTPELISISQRSTLVIRGENIVIESLKLDGALTIDVDEGGQLTVKALVVHNDGWTFEEFGDEEQERAEEILAIRGYSQVRHDARQIRVGAGDHIIIDGDAKLAHKSLGEIHTGHTSRGGLTVSTGQELETASNVREVKPKEGCGCVVA